jgi:acyl-CoA thioesterase FadM
MKFVKEYTTRWHDTDATRIVRPTQLLVYMQETSNAHLDSMGHNLDRLRDEHSLAFLLSKTKIALYAPLYAHEEIRVETFTAESRAFGFNRYYRILRGDEVIAAADTTWALIDLNSRQLCKADAFDFGFEHEPSLDIGLPPRFRVPHNDELELLGERRIVYSDLDYNMHMNNTRYADMLCDFLPLEEVGRIRGMSLAYLNEAAFGQSIRVFGQKQENAYRIRTVNGDGVTCLEAELLLS